MDSSDPKFSFEIVSQPSDAAASSMVSEKCEHEYNTKTTISPAAINREIVDVNEENEWIVVGAEETDAQQINSISSNQRPMIESAIHEYQALRNQNRDCIIENVEAGQTCHLNQSSCFDLGSVQIEKHNEHSPEATAVVTTAPILKEAQYDPEAFLHHGIQRCSLHLEDTPFTVINPPAQSPSHSGGQRSPLQTPCTPIKGKEIEKCQPLYPQSRNSTVNIPKPSGIGLHLNSIISVMQAGSGAIVNTKSAQTFNFSIRGKKSTPTINTHLSDLSKSPSIFIPPENVSACSDDTAPKIHPSAAVDSVTSLSTAIIDSSSNLVDDKSAQANKRLYTDIETDGISEEFNSNPKKKRRRSSDSSDGDGDGCKRCHCRKSKCLKLYCDCFAAGLYCAGSCACQGCFNRPEYVDKVLESRKQIETRNPLAFAPKIVKHIIEPPARSPGEDESHITPSSARHKRGCNCKKSMCLKKYCECYHANVGCSDGCRCEGCKNVFGLKGEYSLDKDVMSKEDIIEITDDSFLESMPSGLCHSELTPRTPAVQFKKDVREGSLRPRQCFQSPESDVTFATPNVMTPLSPMNSDNNAMVSEASQEVLDQVSSHQEVYYGNVQTRKTGDLAGSNQYISAGSLSFLRSPGTPIAAQSSASRPLKAVEVDGEFSNTMQDDTPDILKDNPAPLNAVKSSSPNKKRVSPPHAVHHEHGLRSLNGLRTGRKFILKAVPSVPPQDRSSHK